MKTFIGLIMIVAGVVFGVYAGLWWAFIGGIVDIVEAAKVADVQAFDIAIGAAKVVFSGAIGTLAALILIVHGIAMSDKL